MSRKYKFHNKNELYFVSFATINWIDVFTRQAYFDILAACVNYCRKEKGMELYCYCFVVHPEDWKYASTRNFQEDHTILQIDTIGFFG